MGGEAAVYIGLRGAPPTEGERAPTVVGVREGETSRLLQKHPGSRILGRRFEWGFEAGLPSVLAEAILADRLGSNPDPALTTAFAREVVGWLEGDFELPVREVDEWLAHRLLEVTAH
jgi:hypothetical protein